MFRKALILATLGASLAAPTFAAGVSQGVVMQARILGLNAEDYSAAELSLIEEARRSGDSVTEQALVNHSLRSGFESTYFVDAATLSSSEN